MTKQILGNFLEAHVDRVDGANESPRDTLWSMLVNFNMLTYSYTPDCMTKVILGNFLEAHVFSGEAHSRLHDQANPEELPRGPRRQSRCCERVHPRHALVNVHQLQRAHLSIHPRLHDQVNPGELPRNAI